MALLRVEGLQVGFAGHAQPVLAGVDFAIQPGETVALVGESGSGKSVTALAIMRLLPKGASMLSGRIRFEGQDVPAMPPQRLNRLRGGEIAMLFQQPVSMLDPTATYSSPRRCTTRSPLTRSPLTQKKSRSRSSTRPGRLRRTIASMRAPLISECRGMR